MSVPAIATRVDLEDFPARQMALISKVAETTMIPASGARCAQPREARGRGAMVAICIAFLVGCTLTGPAPALDAFPGATGYGRATQGGRGGPIIYVTNLKDAGPGSFRACAEATGRRTCIFRVGGVIILQNPIAITATRGSLSIL